MRLHVRIYVAIAGGLLGIVLAAPAHAGSLTTTNACLYSVNGEYRDQAVKLSGVGSPRDAAAGATATLSGGSISAALPASLPKTGYDLGIFKAGLNQIPSRVWLAIAAANATPATQVRELSVTASTTIKVNAAGAFVSGTPIVVTIPIPNTTWTAAGTGPGRLLPGRAGHAAHPAGRPQRRARRRSPAASSSSRSSPTCASSWTASPARTAAPFKSSPPPRRRRSPRSRPTSRSSPASRRRGSPRRSSRRSAARVGISIACPAGADACKGRVSLRSALALRVTGAACSRSRRRRRYNVAAGATKTVRLTLNPIARKRLAERRTLRTRVTLTPASGVPVKRDLTLQR